MVTFCSASSQPAGAVLGIMGIVFRAGATFLVLGSWFFVGACRAGGSEPGRGRPEVSFGTNGNVLQRVFPAGRRRFGNYGNRLQSRSDVLGSWFLVLRWSVPRWRERAGARPAGGEFRD